LALVQHIFATKEQFDSLAVKPDNALFFIEDTGQLYKGNVLYSDNIKIENIFNKLT
jgi:hypothetical protein